MELNERIRTCRQRSGLTQEQVAEAMDVSRQAVTKWENGQSAPSTEKLFKLAALFGTTVDLLITDDAKQQCPPDECPDKLRFWEDRNFWISFSVGFAVFLVICPYGYNMYIPIVFTLFCTVMTAYSVLTFSVLLYKILSFKTIGEDFGMYLGLLLLGAIGHGIFSVMNWGSWVCLGISVIFILWLLIQKMLENKKKSEKST